MMLMCNMCVEVTLRAYWISLNICDFLFRALQPIKNQNMIKLDSHHNIQIKNA